MGDVERVVIGGESRITSGKGGFESFQLLEELSAPKSVDARLQTENKVAVTLVGLIGINSQNETMIGIDGCLLWVCRSVSESECLNSTGYLSTHKENSWD